ELRVVADRHRPIEHRSGVYPAAHAGRQTVEHDAIGFQYVLGLAGILPPTAQDVRAHRETAIDEVLNCIADLVFVAPGRLDAPDPVADLPIEQAAADDADV